MQRTVLIDTHTKSFLTNLVTTSMAKVARVLHNEPISTYAASEKIEKLKNVLLKSDMDEIKPLMMVAYLDDAHYDNNWCWECVEIIKFFGLEEECGAKFDVMSKYIVESNKQGIRNSLNPDGIETIREFYELHDDDKRHRLNIGVNEDVVWSERLEVADRQGIL